jgi:hypothetical protein
VALGAGLDSTGQSISDLLWGFEGSVTTSLPGDLCDELGCSATPTSSD